MRFGALQPTTHCSSGSRPEARPRTAAARARTCSAAAGWRSWRACGEARAAEPALARPRRGRRVRRRLRRAVDPPAPRLPHGPLRSRKHGAGRLDDGTRSRPARDRPAGARDLAPGGALRSDPGRVRTALVAVPSPELLLTAQAIVVA